jgi:hypothetical protein
VLQQIIQKKISQTFTGQYSQASLTPIIVNTTNQAIYRFPPEVRGCYTDDEFHLKTLTWNEGYRYSIKNCLYSSLLEKVLTNCSCVPDYYGYSKNVSI